MADAFRERQTLLHSFATLTQLASIEGRSLRAPDGEPDDRADSYALACVACQMPQVVPYTGPLCYNSCAPWHEGAPADRAAAAIHEALAELQIDLERDW